MSTWFLGSVKRNFQDCSFLHPEIWEDPGAEDNRKELYQRANGFMERLHPKTLLYFTEF